MIDSWWAWKRSGFPIGVYLTAHYAHLRLGPWLLRWWGQ